jgi:hypothetical protein
MSEDTAAREGVSLGNQFYRFTSTPSGSLCHQTARFAYVGRLALRKHTFPFLEPANSRTKVLVDMSNINVRFAVCAAL